MIPLPFERLLALLYILCMNIYSEISKWRCKFLALGGLFHVSSGLFLSSTKGAAF